MSSCRPSRPAAAATTVAAAILTAAACADTAPPTAANQSAPPRQPAAAALASLAAPADVAALRSALADASGRMARSAALFERRSMLTRQLVALSAAVDAGDVPSARRALALARAELARQEKAPGAESGAVERATIALALDAAERTIGGPSSAAAVGHARGSVR